jgi:Tol biopolymer transport system component
MHPEYSGGNMKPLNLRPEADWRKRFRAADIFWAAIAPQDPNRGVVCTNKDGIYQLYAWDVPAGNLAQVTHQPAGVLWGIISSDGNYIYFLKDEAGNEIGHFVRVPFSGGEAQDISPELPLYSSFAIRQNRLGNMLGFMANGAEGFKVYVKAIGGAPEILYESESLCFGPTFSCDGKIAVIESSERTKSMDLSLLAFDMETGQQTHEL